MEINRREPHLMLTGGLVNAGQTVKHREFGEVVLQFSDELNWHYLRYGYASYGTDLENLDVLTKTQITADMVYQPDQAHWPDDLPSFEAFTSIEEGRKHHPEVPGQFWVAMKASDIENPTIVGDATSKDRKMVRKYTEAANVALNVLEAIRATNPELIADNMPPGWGMNALRMAIQTPPIGIEDRHSIAFMPTSTLPSQHVIVEVMYDNGAAGYSWREGTDEGLGCDAFDTNHGKVIGWRSLQPGHSADQETLDLHAEMLRRIGSAEQISIDTPRG